MTKRMLDPDTDSVVFYTGNRYPFYRRGARLVQWLYSSVSVVIPMSILVCVEVIMLGAVFIAAITDAQSIVPLGIAFYTMIPISLYILFGFSLLRNTKLTGVSYRHLYHVDRYYSLTSEQQKQVRPLAEELWKNPNSPWATEYKLILKAFTELNHSRKESNNYLTGNDARLSNLTSTIKDQIEREQLGNQALKSFDLPD